MEHPFYTVARETAGGSLTKEQVNALNEVFAMLQPTPKGYVLDAVGINLIKGFEGLELKAYPDSGNIWTIGHGTIKYPNGKAVAKGDTCTAAQAVEYMKNDLKGFEAKVNSLVTVPLTQNQYNALVSLVYNIGQGAFASSTLLKKLNAKDYAGAAAQFLVWNKVNGKTVQGLVNRRTAEKKVFETK